MPIHRRFATPAPSANADVFAGADYFSHVIWYYQWVGVGLDLRLQLPRAIAKIGNAPIPPFVDTGICVLTFLRGIGHFALMCGLSGKDEARGRLLSGKMSDPAFQTKMTQHPDQAQQHLDNAAGTGHVMYAPARTGVSSAQWLAVQRNCWIWRDQMKGNIAKTTGNLLDTVPEIAMLGSHDQLIEDSYGISLGVEAVLDVVAIWEKAASMWQEPARTRLFSSGLGYLHARGHTGQGVRIGHLDSGVTPDADIRLDAFRMLALDGVSSRSEPPSDPFGHGTATASLIAAAAPGADILSGAVFDGGAVLARMVLGLDWLADCAPDIVNLSFGIARDCPLQSPLITVLTGRGALVLAPASNVGAGRATQPGLHPDVLTIGATARDGRIAPFSGSHNAGRYGGAIKPDCAAPGVDVPVRMPGGRVCHAGVSFTCAQAAGIAAVLKGAMPAATLARLAHALVSSAAPLEPAQLHRARGGEIRHAEALGALSGDAPVCRPKAPPSQAHWRDPRLLGRLATALPDTPVEAVLWWPSFEQRDGITAPLGLRRHVALHNAPMSIVQAECAVLTASLGKDAIIAAGSVDLDLSAA